MIDRISDLFNLSNKTALVTGGANGIGREIAQLLGQAGARLVVADIDEEAGRAAAEDLRKAGLLADFLPVDIGDPGSVRDLFFWMERDGTELDILVNNAAIFPKYDTLEIKPNLWDEVHGVTLRGTMLMSQSAVRKMRKQGRGGRIVNISSCSSVQTLVHGNVAYGAAKAGVNMLTRTYALEFSPDAITVNAVLPGGVATDGARSARHTYRISGPITGENRVPLGRPGTPTDIAAAVLYLASPAASYVTGQLLAVDGGFLVS